MCRVPSSYAHQTIATHVAAGPPAVCNTAATAEPVLVAGSVLAAESALDVESVPAPVAVAGRGLVEAAEYVAGLAGSDCRGSPVGRLDKN